MTAYHCLSCHDVYDGYEKFYEHFRERNLRMNYLDCQKRTREAS